MFRWNLFHGSSSPSTHASASRDIGIGGSGLELGRRAESRAGNIETESPPAAGVAWIEKGDSTPDMKRDSSVFQDGSGKLRGALRRDLGGRCYPALPFLFSCAGDDRDVGH